MKANKPLLVGQRKPGCWNPLLRGERGVVRPSDMRLSRTCKKASPCQAELGLNHPPFPSKKRTQPLALISGAAKKVKALSAKRQPADESNKCGIIKQTFYPRKTNPSLRAQRFKKALRYLPGFLLVGGVFRQFAPSSAWRGLAFLQARAKRMSEGVKGRKTPPTRSDVRKKTKRLS